MVVGGLLADVASWRVGFLMNVPIGAALLIATLVSVRETPRTGGRFDVAGAVTSTLGMTALVYGITRTADAGWTDPVALTSITAGLVVIAGFIVIEWRAPQPILPLRVLADPVRGGAFLARMLFAGAIFGYFFFASQYMQGVLGSSPLLAGLGFLPMTAVQFALSLTVPRLTRRYGNGTLVATGLAITLVGMIWISFVSPDSDYWTALALPMLLLGAGQGIGFAPLTAAGVTRIESRDAGAAAGTVNVAHQLGGALGVSVMVAVATAGITSTDPASIAAEASTGLATGAVLLALALTSALLLIVRRHRGQQAAHPAIAAALPDLAAYDTILLGSPVWNVQAPMIMRTFVESVDLTGKTVHPFVTYAVSRMGRVRDDYAEMLPDAIVTEGLAIEGETVRDARPDIQRWLQAIGGV